MKRSIEIADHAGYCFGVRRALDMAAEHLGQKAKKVYSLGPIIHNPRVVEEFRRKGLIPIESVDDIAEGVLVVRSHGVEKEVFEAAQAKGLEVIDASCPFVKNTHRLAHQLSHNGYQLVIVGEEAHPEVKGVLSYAGKDPIVANSVEQLQNKKLSQKLGVIAQTTQTLETFMTVVGALLGNAYECRVFNTICNATASRQTATVELAQAVDVMFVVGGKNSANTARLAELCREAGPTTFHIETPDEITSDMVRGARRVGITAGASTPRSQVDLVKQKLDAVQE